MDNKTLRDHFIDMANSPMKPLYEKVSRIISKATRWSPGWQALPPSRPGIPDKGFKMNLDCILSSSFAVEMYFLIRFKQKMAVSLNLEGIAFNIEELGWTKIIPHEELEQNPFQENLAAVFPHGLENDTEDLYHARIRTFLEQYPS